MKFDVKKEEEKTEDTEVVGGCVEAAAFTSPVVNRKLEFSMSKSLSMHWPDLLESARSTSLAMHSPASISSFIEDAVSTALQRWKKYMSETQRLTRCASRMSLGIQRKKLFSTIDGWKQQNDRNMLRSAEKIALFRRSMCLAAAMSKWMGSWKEKRWNTVFVGMHRFSDSRRILWQRLFEFVPLVVFVLSIVYFDSDVCKSLFKNSIFEETTATSISFSRQLAFGAGCARVCRVSSDCNSTIPSKLSRHEENDWNEIKVECVRAMEGEVSPCSSAKSEPRNYQCLHQLDAREDLEEAHRMDAQDSAQVRSAMYYKKMQSDTSETLKAKTKEETDMSGHDTPVSRKRWQNKWRNARLPEAEASNYRKKMRSDTSETLEAKTKEKANVQVVQDVGRGAVDAQDSAQVRSALDSAQVKSAEDAQAQAVLGGRSCVARGLEVVRCSNYYRKRMKSDTSETLKATTKEEADMQLFSNFSWQRDAREEPEDAPRPQFKSSASAWIEVSPWVRLLNAFYCPHLAALLDQRTLKSSIARAGQIKSPASASREPKNHSKV
jgi:hypothetical protein